MRIQSVVVTQSHAGSTPPPRVYIKRSNAEIGSREDVEVEKEKREIGRTQWEILSVQLCFNVYSIW